MRVCPEKPFLRDGTGPSQKIIPSVRDSTGASRKTVPLRRYGTGPSRVTVPSGRPPQNTLPLGQHVTKPSRITVPSRRYDTRPSEIPILRNSTVRDRPEKRFLRNRFFSGLVPSRLDSNRL